MLTQEEKDAAAELEKDSKNEKSELAKIGEGLEGVQNLLKSQVEKKEEPKEEIDFESISPEELAKSMIGDKEKATDFIAKFAEYAGVSPQDMFDENDEQFITDDMRKGLEESEETGQRLMKGILYSMEESTKRTQKVNEVLFGALSILVKSIEGLTSESTKINETVEEMKKSMATEIPKSDQEIPNLEGNADDPLSQIEHASGTPTLDYNTQMHVLKKSFPMDGTIEEQSAYQTYAGMVDKEIPFDQIISKMPMAHQQVTKGNLLEFQGA